MDYKPEEKGSPDFGDLMAVGNLVDVDGQNPGRLLSDHAMPRFFHFGNRTKASSRKVSLNTLGSVAISSCSCMLPAVHSESLVTTHGIQKVL